MKILLFVLISVTVKYDFYVFTLLSSKFQSTRTLSLKATSIPKHIAFIVDGNGRWAYQKGLDRTIGHSYGAKRAVEIVKYCFETGISTVTLYLFSTENWNRPMIEVQGIMYLLEVNLSEFKDYFQENNIVVKTIGQTNRLPESIQQLLSHLTNSEHVSDGQKVLCLAISYGGRQDITQACKKLALAVLRNELSVEDIDEDRFSQFTSTGSLGISDPCLIVRTSGEQRLSNFLLWQCAYSELSTVPCMWPDFDTGRLSEVLADFSKRRRRFGRVDSPGSAGCQ